MLCPHMALWHQPCAISWMAATAGQQVPAGKGAMGMAKQLDSSIRRQCLIDLLRTWGMGVLSGWHLGLRVMMQIDREFGFTSWSVQAQPMQCGASLWYLALG